MRVTKPVRLFILSAVIAAIVSARLGAENHKKAVKLSNNSPTVLTNSLLDTVEGLFVDLQWEVMLRKVDNLIPASKFAQIPNLISTSSLVDRVQTTALVEFDVYKAGLLSTQTTILHGKLPALAALTVNSLRDKMQSYTSNPMLLQVFEQNVQATVGSLTATCREVITDNTNNRLHRVSHVFKEALKWKSVTYQRFLDEALKIRRDLHADSELEIWVRLETQDIIRLKHIGEYLSAAFFEQYIGNADALVELLDAKFHDAADVDADLDRFFSRRVANVDGILLANYSRVYSVRVDTIDADPVLDDNQKRILKSYARAFREQQQASRVSVSANIDQIRSLYREYSVRLLREIRVVVLAAFLEYEAISLRATAEGRQTCIIQFYNMRSSLDDAFFFEYSRDRDFDLELTRSDFLKDFDSRMKDVAESVFPYTRTGYIMSMYDQAWLFVMGRASFFFRDDDLLLSTVKPMLETLHDNYANIIPQRLQQGIEMDVQQETEIARLHIEATLQRFSSNMEFAFVAHAIDEVRTGILNEVGARVSEVQELFALLSEYMVHASLVPFDFAWFEAQAAEFLTDDKIRYIDMKEHVIDTTNQHAREVVAVTREAYTQKVETLFQNVHSFTEDASADLRKMIRNTQLQDSSATLVLRETLSQTLASLESLTGTMKSTTLTHLETMLGDAIRDVGVVQGVRLQNFFNTKIQKIKHDYTTSVIARATEVYERHMDIVEQEMLNLSSLARREYRKSVDELLDIERGFRGNVEEVAAPVLKEEADKILADYNIISFNARQSVLIPSMRNKATAAARSVASRRRAAISEFTITWNRRRRKFREKVQEVATSVRSDFIHDITDVVTFAKGLAVDVMGHVVEVIDALEGELFNALEIEFTRIVDSVIATNDNDLPELLNLENVVLPQGIMDLTETPVIPSLAFIREYEAEGDLTIYDDSGEALPYVDEPSGLTTVEIVLALMPYDDWQTVKIKEIVQNVVVEMQDGLRQNTCRNNKPPCREGWVEFQNEFDVPCCRFDPASQGFPAWKVAKMLMFEIMLALLLDMGHIHDFAKWAIKPVGESKLKSAAKKTAQTSHRLAIKGQRMMAKSMQKFAGKSSKGMTKAIKLSSRVAGRAMKKIAKSAAVKTGTIVARRVGIKLATVGTKMLTKLSLGPVGIALMVFDLLSLALDLWDPEGYNDAQTAGEIRQTRDAYEQVWKETLDNNGMESPLLADPAFYLSEDQQTELYTDVCIEWMGEEQAKFLTRNEASFDEMPDSEVEAAIAEEFDRLQTRLEEEPNLGTTLFAAKLENAFLQDINVRESHQHPYTDDGKDSTRKHSRRNLESSGIVEAVLNETGVQAFNRFHVKKAAFMSSFMWNPMKRFVKREHDYVIVKEVPKLYGSQALYLRTGVRGSRSNMLKTRSMHEPNTPTIEGTIEYAERYKHLEPRFYPVILQHVEEGWFLKDVDAEEEFWVQYEPDKSVDELLDRTKYQATHDKIAAANQKEFESLVDIYISLELDSLAEKNETDSTKEVSFDHLKVVHLAKEPKNWSTDKDTGKKVLMYPLSADIDDADKIKYTIETLPPVPSWAGTYDGHKKVVEDLLEEQYARDFDEKQSSLEPTPDTGRFTMGEYWNQDPAIPEWAVFLNGYGQSSPLYSVHKQCQDMGHGVEYDEKKGLCSFTKSYCQRYGLDHFYNKDLGVHDCDLSKGQEAAEFIFGTTTTRNLKRGGEKLVSWLSAPASLGRARVGTCRKAVGRVRVYDGVEAKHVQNAEMSNYIPTAKTLDVISTLRLSGF